MTPTPSIERLMQLLKYDPETGQFTWTTSRQKVRAGQVAGSFNAGRYRQINVGGCVMLAHRIAFVFMTGDWPKQQVDHKNGIRSDNRWVNLRDVPPCINHQNIVRPHADNKLQLQGVVSAPGGKFDSHICVDGRKIGLGRFDEASEAHAAYLSAKRRAHEGCTI